ncbi:putative protein [Streptomyces sp. enrichment culture]
MTELLLLLALALTLACAVFVAAEFSLTTVERADLERAAEAVGAQLGITVSSLVLGAVAEPAIAHLLEPPFQAIGVPEGLIHPIALVIALTVATYLHMLFGEMIPKSIALAAPVPTALFLKPPLIALTRALRPVVFSVNALANTLLRLLKVESKDEVSAVLTDDELARLVTDSSQAGLLAPADGERLRDALELGTRPVGEVLVLLAKMSMVDHRVIPPRWRGPRQALATPGCPWWAPAARSWATCASRTPSACLSGISTSPAPPCTVIRVQIDTPLDDALTAMRVGGTHLAAVTGDKGTVIDFVTMEDVLSELVGPAA